MSRAVVHVSIHDVSPRWEREVETALAWCHAVGARPGLLVVPDFHGEWFLGDHPAYVDRLRELAGDGHEVFLHGWFHRSAPGEGLAHHFAQRVASAGEAEFASYDVNVGCRRLDEGLSLLRGAGLDPVGFVPPAWARRSWLLPALAERGLRWCEDQLFGYDPVAGSRAFCPALNFASRTLGRRLSSVAYARAARLYPAAEVPVRVALHPADLHHELLVRETRSVLEWARDRTVDTVASLL